MCVNIKHREIRVMKLFMAIMGWRNYDGGLVLGVYDSKQKAEDRIEKYTHYGKYGDNQKVMILDLNTDKEIDI